MMSQFQKYQMRLRDDQWRQLEPFLIGKADDPGCRGKDNRLFIEAVLWIVSGKYSWNSIPPQFGTWRSIYMRFRRWSASKVWLRLTQNKIDDPELLLMLEEIADFANLYNQRFTKRS
jgi:transposase